MRFAATRLLCFAALALSVIVQGDAQERAPATDPRVGLKAGLRDAGQAIRNMELLATLPKPEGFFDPPAAAGVAAEPAPTPPPPSAGEPAGAAPSQPPRGGGGFTNSDLAFHGNHVVVGNYHGFNSYDIENARKPRLVASVVCPGGQGDVSIHGNLLFMSVEQTRGRIDCGTQGVEAPVSAERFRGIRIFDITDLNRPKQVAAVQTCRGSHTHTLVIDPDDKANIYVYGSGTCHGREGGD